MSEPDTKGQDQAGESGFPPPALLERLAEVLPDANLAAFLEGSRGQAGTWLRVNTLKSSVEEVLGQDFVQTLRAKGLGEMAVLRHAVKNAMPQIVAMLGLQLGYLIGGSVLVEMVFNWPGTGYLLNKAILSRDLPVLQGTILVLAASFVMINLVIDLVQSMIDPRIKRS